jgi:5-methylcytosine-specific restriction endonuclease McrA
MPGDRFYHTMEWQNLRAAALRRDGYRCTVKGCSARATHVDHVISRRDGGPDVLSNLRSLCKQHDNQVMQGPDGKRRSGGRPFLKGCDADGMPLDPAHWWKQ